VALAIYNIGVLGRPQSEVVENSDERPPSQLRPRRQHQPDR
jgi:ABC-type phosphate/phosphonate transport system permease subunit